MQLSFKKTERLKSRKAIEALFSEGKSFKKYPVKLFFLPKEDLKNTQVGFAVPKRLFKSAVDRNRIKRQLREAYRLQKHVLTDNNGKKFALLLLYLGKEKPQYAVIENALNVLLKKLSDEK